LKVHALKWALEGNDLNTLAAHIASQTTGQELPKPQTHPVRKKNPAAVALGKLEASKGGYARRDKLSKKRRKEIAKAAASVRWQKILTEGE
jgi:hypothetical protein